MTAKRPPFVSVIAGILIAFSTFLLFEIVTSPSDRTLTLKALGVLFIYYVPMALGLLMGKNWARILFLWFMAASLLFQLKGGVHGLLVANIVFYLGSAYFLTRPAAIDFFLPNDQAARWNRTAYWIVGALILINFTGMFFPSTIKGGLEKFTQWAVETFHIGYVDHDIASLKLPSDWIEGSVLKGWAAMARPGGFEAMAWGGLSVFGVSEVDIETGQITQRDDSNSFIFEPEYIRDDGTLMPCGLVRYQLSFPKDTNDPLLQILQSQANYGSNKHQYYRSADFEILEYDATDGGMRFIVWNWQRNDDPHHVYGMIIGLPPEDPRQTNSCHISDILKSLELKDSDGTVWHATGLDTQENPSMLTVAGIRIDLELAHMWRYGIDGEAFFTRLNGYLNQNSNFSVETLSRYRLLSTDSPVLTLSDIAKVYETGRGRPIMDDPWYLKTVELHVEQCGSWRDLNDYERLYLKAAIDSKIPFKLNCN